MSQPEESDLDRVLERVVNDEAFMEALRREPVAALHGYDLSDDDRAVLASSIGEDPGSLTSVEERQNKATLVGLASSLLDAAHASGGAGASGSGSGGSGASAASVLHSLAPATDLPPPPSGGLHGAMESAQHAMGGAMGMEAQAHGTAGAAPAVHLLQQAAEAAAHHEQAEAP